MADIFQNHSIGIKERTLSKLKSNPVFTLVFNILRWVPFKMHRTFFLPEFHDCCNAMFSPHPTRNQTL